MHVTYGRCPDTCLTFRNYWKYLSRLFSTLIWEAFEHLKILMLMQLLGFKWCWGEEGKMKSGEDKRPANWKLYLRITWKSLLSVLQISFLCKIPKCSALLTSKPEGGKRLVRIFYVCCMFVITISLHIYTYIWMYLSQDICNLWYKRA